MLAYTGPMKIFSGTANRKLDVYKRQIYKI